MVTLPRGGATSSVTVGSVTVGSRTVEVAAGLGVEVGEALVALGLDEADADALVDVVGEVATELVGASVGVSDVLTPPPQAESAKTLMLAATRRKECRGDLRGLILHPGFEGHGCAIKTFGVFGLARKTGVFVGDVVYHIQQIFFRFGAFT